MDEQSKKAFDFAADLTKQLITVAAALVTLSVTFSKDTPAAARGWAYGAWAVFLASIVCGFLTLMSLTAELQPKPAAGAAAAGKPAPSIWGKGITFFSIGQIFFFAIAIGLTGWFGKTAMQHSEKPQTPPPQLCNCVLPAAPANPIVSASPTPKPSGTGKRQR